MVRVKFIKSGSPYGLAYGSGHIGELYDEKQAKELAEIGVCEIIENYSDLPEGFPGRDKLVGFGFDTAEKLKQVADLTEIDGIGKSLAAKIKAALNDL